MDTLLTAIHENRVITKTTIASIVKNINISPSICLSLYFTSWAIFSTEKRMGTFHIELFN